MPPNTDRPINRVMVVGCAVSATSNHLKLHEPGRLKVLFSNIHAKTRKLWKHSAMRLAASRTNAVHQFTNRPLMNSVCPPRCPLHSPGLTCMRACTSPHAGAASTIEIATNIRSPWHSLHCRVPYFPRLRALLRVSDAGRRSAWIASSCRRPKTYTKAEALDWTIILQISQLGGLHGAQ